MKKEIAKALYEKSQEQCNWDDEDLSLRDGYSGRGMYGRGTWAVSGDEGVFTTCVIGCVRDIIIDAETEDDSPPDMHVLANEVEAFLQAALGATTDSMGMGVVWY